MSSAPVSTASIARIALTATAVLATGVVAYAAYFDYRRRNDPVFRKKLAKQRNRIAKSDRQSRETGTAELLQTMKRAVRAIAEDDMPVDVEAREQYFMQQVSLGEQLAARGTEDFFVASAVAFFKALKVYPSPSELLMIYQKTQPPPVFQLVIQLVEMDNEYMMEKQRGAGARGAADLGQAILTEIEVETTVEVEVVEKEDKATPAAGSENGSGSGSYVEVEKVEEVKTEGEKVEEEKKEEEKAEEVAQETTA